jgi:beta-lactamase superfamily II metal-dependent hydrolase
MKRIVLWVFLFLLLQTALAAKNRIPHLDIYSIDVEGGQSTLFVSPSGESLLIDTGWPGFNGRDADRIVAAAKAAGVSKLDYVLITHFHRDHVGGITQLAAKMPIGKLIDHGPNLEDSDVTREDYAAYEKVAANHKRLTLKPGQRVPIKGVEVLVLTAAGNHLSKPLRGAGQPNSACSAEPKPETDTTENSKSLGTLITYGKFKVLDLGDLTKDKELELVCPKNLIGTVDLFIISHHGSNQSNSKALVSAIRPKAAIMNNGARKGGSPEAWQIVHDVVGDNLWQLHYSVEGGPKQNSDEGLIANPDEKEDPGNYIEVEAFDNGGFMITNPRNGQQKGYNMVIDVVTAGKGR